MTQSIGKHILIDCYGCRASRIDSPTSLQRNVPRRWTGSLSDNYDIFHTHPEGCSMTAIGMNSHICLHAYPDYDYVAVDVFTFDTPVEATATMKIFRQHFRPDKIRATSVKRQGRARSRHETNKFQNNTMAAHENYRQENQNNGRKSAEGTSPRRAKQVKDVD